MLINDVYKELRDSLKGVSILFHKSVISIKIGLKKELIIEMLKDDKANLYLVGYKTPIDEQALEIRDEVIVILSQLGIDVNFKAPFYDYLVKSLVKRHGGMIYKSNNVMVLFKRNEKGDFDEFPTSYNDDDKYYIVSGTRPELEEIISVKKAS